MTKFSKLFKNPKVFFTDSFKNKFSGFAPRRKNSAANSVETTIGRLQMLKYMGLDGDYDVVKRAWNQMETTGIPWDVNLASFLSIKAEMELVQANHDAVMHFGGTMVNEYNSAVGYYYRAKSLFVRGEYDEAMAELANLVRTRPNHADGVYLLCEICERTGNYELAWQSLETLAETSRRNKTWHVMANLISGNPDLFRLLQNWRKWKENGIGPAFQPSVSEFIALGALRAGNFEMARRIWRETLFAAACRRGGFSKLKKRTSSYSNRRAEAALSDLNAMCNNAKIEMFLVSGTLLGCIRQNGLLAHDKDIDVGIWSKVPADKMYKLATTSGKFFVIKSRAPEILRLRHVNGIAIDVFYHFKKRSDYWHGGVKMIWHNTPFKLEKRNFLGEEYLIPSNYDLYLTENYGDWRTPMICFDSAFDTPNGEIRSENEMAIHTFKGLLASCIDQNWDRVAFYLDKLGVYGEDEFVSEFENKHLNFEEIRTALKKARQSTSPNVEV